MAKAEIKTEILIKGISAVENLVELIAKYQNDLPLELQNSLKEVAEYGIGDLNADDYFKEFGNKSKLRVVCEEIENTNKITNINKVLKKVFYVTEECLEKSIYPKSFKMYVNDELVVGW